MPYNFARSAKWCPDGAATLAQCEDRTFHIWNPLATARNSTDSAVVTQPIPSQSRTFQQQGPILDYAWYPSASVSNPAAFCFLASVRECPVKLLDASDGRLRASYRIVDHRERQIAPHSVSFNATFDRIYGGFEDAIEVFDVQRPGEGSRLHVTPSKNSKDGLKGIVSSLAFSADAASRVYAAGSLSPATPSSSNIAVFSETTGEVPMMFVGAENESLGGSYGIRDSVMQLMFNPTRPYLLYASFRRYRTIYTWDLRSDVSKPVYAFDREASRSGGYAKEVISSTATNQKLRFDVDIGGQLLGMGDQHGTITLFDAISGSGNDVSHPSESEVSTLRPAPVLQYKAHRDAIGSVGFHPFRPLLLSVSGSRHFDVKYSASECGSESSTSNSESDEEEAGGNYLVNQNQSGVVKLNRRGPKPTTFDASTKLWGFETRAKDMYGTDSSTAH